MAILPVAIIQTNSKSLEWIFRVQEITMDNKTSAPREEVIIAQTASGDAKAEQSQDFTRVE